MCINKETRLNGTEASEGAINFLVVLKALLAYVNMGVLEEKRPD
jgi:hypothetical protein